MIKYYRNSDKTPQRYIQLHKQHHHLEHSRYNIREEAAKGTEKEDEGGEGDEGDGEEENKGEEARTRSVCRRGEVSNYHNTNTM